MVYKKECVAIENVQRRATKIVKTLSEKPYNERYRELGHPVTAIQKRMSGHD